MGRVGFLRGLHREERGAEAGINKLLILALVGVPLVVLLVAFGGKTKAWAIRLFNAVMSMGR